MRTKQLKELGVPDECYAAALAGIQSTVKAGRLPARELKQRIGAVVAEPERFRDDPHFASLANGILEAGRFVPLQPISYRTWGEDIDEGSHVQMRQACSVPGVRGAALMPDAHVGYGLPIGGVLAVEGAVIPYAVGVDIACRMKLSVLDAPPQSLIADPERWKTALEKGTRFGVGVEHKKPHEHAVMDRDWTVTRITREHRDRAWRQLGTSGSGNHFVEFGVLTISDADSSGEGEKSLGLAPGTYMALLSHSGSRGAGAAVCNVYSNIAQSAAAAPLRRTGSAGVARPRQRGRPGILAGDEPDGRLCRRQPRRDSPERGSIGGSADHRRRGEPPQLRLERSARRTRSDRASQGRDAGRQRCAGSDSRLDGDASVCGARTGESGQPRLGLARRRAADVAALRRSPSSHGTRSARSWSHKAFTCCRPAATKCPASTKTSRR